MLESDLPERRGPRGLSDRKSAAEPSGRPGSRDLEGATQPQDLNARSPALERPEQGQPPLHPEPQQPQGSGPCKRSGQRWCEFNSASTLQLAPLLDRLLEPIACIDLTARIRLGLQEALVNAVCHGNGRDPALTLRIRRIECQHWWVFQVQDQGDGVPRACRLGRLPSDPGACAGRGLYLIQTCFDDVRWSSRGNRLQLAVRRQRPWVGQPGSLSSPRSQA